MPRLIFDFSAAKRTSTHQDEVIILALAKSCSSTHKVILFAARKFSSIYKPVLINRLELKLKQIWSVLLLIPE